MSRRLLTTTIHIGVACFIFMMLFFFYLFVVDGNPPIEVAQPIQMEPEIVTPGDTVYMNVKFCKNTEDQPYVTSYWQKTDGDIFGITAREIALSGKECKEVTLPLDIPDDMPPGSWKRVSVGEYQVNFIKNRTARWESEYIKVEVEEQ